MAKTKLTTETGKGITTVESNEFQNYIENSTARVGTTGWSRYATSSASAIPSNFGGSPNASFTHARNTSSPLRGSTDFLLTKDAANRQGHGIYYSFNIDRADRGQILNFEITHKESANFIDGDLRVYLVTSSDDFGSVINVIEGSVRDLTGWGGASGSKFLTSFQTNVDDTRGRLCIHVAGTGTTSWTMEHIDAMLGRTNRAQGALVTDWKSFTPTGSWVTNTTYAGRYRLVGDSLEVRYQLDLTGAPTNASLTLNLPSGFTIDTTKTISGTSAYTILGHAMLRDTGSSGYDAMLAYTSPTSVIVRAKDSSSTYTSAATSLSSTIPFTWANTDQVMAYLSVPVLGFGGTVNLDPVQGSPLVAARYTTTAGQSIPNSGSTIVDFGTKDYDSVGAVTTGGSWKFTAPKSGYYKISSGILFSSAATTSGNRRYLDVFKNGSFHTNLDLQDSTAAVTVSLGLRGDTTLFLNKGDYVDLRLFYNRTAGATTLDSNAGYNYVDISEVTAPTQSVGGQILVAAKYNSAAGQSISNAATPIVDFGTKVIDTHNAVTTGGSWKFTAPVSGIYNISANIRFANSLTWSAGTGVGINIYKNGVLYSNDDYLIAAAGTFGAAPSTAIDDIIELVQGDYVDIRVSHGESSARALVAAGGLVRVSIQKI